MRVRSLLPLLAAAAALIPSEAQVITKPAQPNKFIEAVGRLTAPGNPFQYGTTPDFLLHFGLRSLADLPPLGQVEGRDARTVLEAVSSAALVEQEEKKSPD